MDTARSVLPYIDDSKQWPFYAGLYLFICGVGAVFVLSDFISVMADVIGLPTNHWIIVMPSPAIVIGAVLWWTIVERRDSYMYVIGSGFGFLTGVVTAGVWAGLFVHAWGVKMLAVPTNVLLIALSLGFAAVIGALMSLPLMYARRWVHSELEAY